MMDISVFDKILTHKGVNQRIVANTYLYIINTANSDFLIKNSIVCDFT